MERKRLECLQNLISLFECLCVTGVEPGVGRCRIAQETYWQDQNNARIGQIRKTEEFQFEVEYSTTASEWTHLHKLFRKGLHSGNYFLHIYVGQVQDYGLFEKNTKSKQEKWLRCCCCTSTI